MKNRSGEEMVNTIVESLERTARRFEKPARAVKSARRAPRRVGSSATKAKARATRRG